MRVLNAGALWESGSAVIMVQLFLKTLPSLLQCYTGGRPGQQGIKWELLCLSLGKWSRTECLLLWASFSDGWWEELDNVVFGKATRREKNTGGVSFSPLPPNQIWSISNCPTEEPDDPLINTHFPLCWFPSFTGFICMNMLLLFLSETLTNAKDKFSVRFKKELL